MEGAVCSVVRANGGGGGMRSKLQLSRQDIKRSPQVGAARIDAVSLSAVGCLPSQNVTDGDLRAPMENTSSVKDEWAGPEKVRFTVMHLGRPHTGAGTWDVSQHPSVSQGPHRQPSLPYQRVFGRRASTTERKKSQHFNSLLIQFFTWSDLNIYGRRCRYV